MEGEVRSISILGVVGVAQSHDGLEGSSVTPSTDRTTRSIPCGLCQPAAAPSARP